MTRQGRKYTFAVVIGLVSEILPVPGLLSAAVFFPQGIEGDHAMAYLVLALSINFAVFYWIAYLLAQFIWRS